MDIDDIVRSVRPEVGVPTADVVARNRSRVTGQRSRPARRVPTRALVYGALAVAAVAVAGFGSTVSGGDDAPDVSLADTEASAHAGTSVAIAPDRPTTTIAVPTTTIPPMCGDDMPITIGLPGAADVEPAPTVDPLGHLLVHYDGPQFDVELRWPAPPQPTIDRPAAMLDPAERITAASWSAGSAQVDLGERDTVDLNHDPVMTVEVEFVPTDERCSVVEVLRVRDGLVIDRFGWRPSTPVGADFVDLDPLLRSDIDVPPPPTDVESCAGAAGASPPNQGDTVDEATAVTPSEALRAFLQTPTAATFYKSGWVEMPQPDGSYVYGAPLETSIGEFDLTRFVTLVNVSPTGDGTYRVESYRVSGC